MGEWWVSVCEFMCLWDGDNKLGTRNGDKNEAPTEPCMASPYVFGGTCSPGRAWMSGELKSPSLITGGGVGWYQVDIRGSRRGAGAWGSKSAHCWWGRVGRNGGPQRERLMNTRSLKEMCQATNLEIEKNGGTSVRTEEAGGGGRGGGPTTQRCPVDPFERQQNNPTWRILGGQ